MTGQNNWSKADPLDRRRPELLFHQRERLFPWFSWSEGFRPKPGSVINPKNFNPPSLFTIRDNIGSAGNHEFFCPLGTSWPPHPRESIELFDRGDNGQHHFNGSPGVVTGDISFHLVKIALGTSKPFERALPPT